MPQKKILIVDDDQSLADMLAVAVSSGGYAVQTATSGLEALNRVKEWLPDLILLDIQLPDISGLEILRQLRSQSAAREAIVILITGSSGLEMKIEGFHTGANDYVSKPIVPRELLLKIERFLQTASNQQAALASKEKETLQALVNTISHELSNPLAAIRNELYLSRQADHESMIEHLRRIEISTRQIEELVKKLQSSIRALPVETLAGVRMFDLNAASRPSPNSDRR
ncbi:MAG: response regulator transcription factor [Acidobacteriota bacterium]